jgi:hypothetical protein
MRPGRSIFTVSQRLVLLSPGICLIVVVVVVVVVSPLLASEMRLARSIFTASQRLVYLV